MKHIWVAAAVLMLAATATAAQTAGTGLPTQITVLPTPPAGFDPFEASAAQLALYGIPPAPDQTQASDAYNTWRRAMSFPTRRASSVTLTIGQLLNGINVPVGTPTPLYNSKWGVASSSTGWSGVSMVDSAKPFGLEQVVGVFTVPTGQPASACQLLSSATGSSTYSTQWVGIDGNGSSDVLQAGIQIETTCLNATAVTSYKPWIEWYPNLEMMVSSPTISPGDLVQINVWATSPTAASAFIEDLSTGVSASFSISAPTGIRLAGDSVEWVIEDPTLSSGSPAAFTNYVASAWPLAAAWNYQASKPNYYYAGQLPTSGELQKITLVDAKRHPLSIPAIENARSLYFQSYTSTCGPQQNWPC